jgi:hypothetical protein
MPNKEDFKNLSWIFSKNISSKHKKTDSLPIVQVNQKQILV